jgi:hypothetical protein
MRRLPDALGQYLRQRLKDRAEPAELGYRPQEARRLLCGFARIAQPLEAERARAHAIERDRGAWLFRPAVSPGIKRRRGKAHKTEQ